MKPWLFLGFRMFTLTLGRVPALARWVKARLVRTLIYKRRTIDVRFTRRIEFTDDAVRVKDVLAGPGGSGIVDLRWSARFTTIHMGSSRYFVRNEIDPVPSGEPVDVSRIASGLTLDRLMNT